MIRYIIISICGALGIVLPIIAAASVTQHHGVQQSPKPPIGFITLNKHNCTYGIGATEDELHIVITGDEQKCYALIRLDGYPLPRGRRAALR